MPSAPTCAPWATPSDSRLRRDGLFLDGPEGCQRARRIFDRYVVTMGREDRPRECVYDGASTLSEADAGALDAAAPRCNAGEVAEHVPQVPFVDHDDVVQALPAQRPDETLRDGVCLRRGNRCEHSLDTNAPRSGDKVAAVRPVAITDQEARFCPPRRRVDQLTPYPLGRRMRGDAQVYHRPTVVGEEDKDIQRLEPERVHGEESRRPDLVPVVYQKRAPARRGVARHVLPIALDRLHAHAVPELAELAEHAHVPHRGFSRVIRRISSANAGSIRGRPRFAPRLLHVQ